MVIAVDFDNTLAYTDFPTIIRPVMTIINLCIERKKLGDTLILNTCRIGKYLDEAVDYCKEYGLEFDYVNENTPELIELFGGNCRKISAHLYIDDKAVNPFDIKCGDMEWAEIKLGIWNNSLKQGEIK